MKCKKPVAKGLCLLLALTLLLSSGMVAFAAQNAATEEQGAAPAAEITKTLYTGGDTEDDLFTLELEALQREVTESSVPLDVAIVLDRSASMDQPASVGVGDFRAFPSYYPSSRGSNYDRSKMTISTNIKNTIAQIEAYLKTLDITKYDGYYRATNMLKRYSPYYLNNHVGFAGEGYASYEPMRYRNGRWEMRITTGYWASDFPGGINTLDLSGGSIMNRQVQWVSVVEGYKEYLCRMECLIYRGRLPKYYDFHIATPKLTKAIDATENFIRNIYDSGKTLPQGQSHRVSVLGFGGGALYVGGRYAYKRYDPTTDRALDTEAVLSEDMGVSVSVTALNSDANLNSVIRVLRSHYTYTNTRTDWALDAVEQETRFLPNPVTGRKRIVVLITDGAPTKGDDMQVDVADVALAAAKRLKEQGVEIYTLGVSNGLSPHVYPSAFNSYNPNDPQNLNSFLAACSSLYPEATAMGNYGRRNSNGIAYYMVDDGTGQQLPQNLSSIVDNLCNVKTEPTYKENYLTLYEEINEEFILDKSGQIRVYAVPYLGGGAYGSKVEIGSHDITSDYLSIVASGYRMELCREAKQTTVRLDWNDAQYAFLREANQEMGSFLSGYLKGYKILLELPLMVNRERTLGGNNIPVDTEQGGLYLPGASASTLGDCLMETPTVNANVYFSGELQCKPYEMTLETYRKAHEGKHYSPEVQNIMEEMCPSYEEYADAVLRGKGKYLSVSLGVYDSLSGLVFEWYAHRGETNFKVMTPILGEDQDEPCFHFEEDQQIRFCLSLTTQNGTYDSCADAGEGKGNKPYNNVYYYEEAQFNAPTFPVAPTSVGHTLDLASDIALNYVVLNEKLQDFDSSVMEVEFKGETVILTPEVKGNFTYYTMEGITAVDMTEKLSAKLRLFIANKEIACVQDTYSAAEYAYSQLNKAYTDPKLKEVCANLLRYGALAQAYKGNNNTPADAAMTEEQKEYLTDLQTVSAVSVKEVLNDVEKPIPWSGNSLILDSKIAVKSVFDLDGFAGGLGNLNLRVSYTNTKGEVCNLVIDTIEIYDEELGLYAFVLDTLLATEMRTVLTMALYEGDQQISQTMIYSVESYCAARLGALKELGLALLAYSDAARTYFVN